MRTPSTERALRAGIYVRLSKWEPSTPDLDSSAMTRHEPDCRDLCDRRGWQVAGRYIDEDCSAFTGRAGPTMSTYSTT